MLKEYEEDEDISMLVYDGPESVQSRAVQALVVFKLDGSAFQIWGARTREDCRGKGLMRCMMVRCSTGAMCDGVRCYMRDALIEPDTYHTL